MATFRGSIDIVVNQIIKGW